MADPASVLDRVRALIELSGSKSESGLDGEATAAAVKACKMIREHKLTVSGATVGVDFARRGAQSQSAWTGMSRDDWFGGFRCIACGMSNHPVTGCPATQKSKEKVAENPRCSYCKNVMHRVSEDKYVCRRKTCPGKVDYVEFESKKAAERDRLAEEQRRKVEKSIQEAVRQAEAYKKQKQKEIEESIRDAVRQAEARTPEEWATAAAAAAEKPKPKEEKK